MMSFNCARVKMVYCVAVLAGCLLVFSPGAQGGYLEELYNFKSGVPESPAFGEGFMICSGPNPVDESKRFPFIYTLQTNVGKQLGVGGSNPHSFIFLPAQPATPWYPALPPYAYYAAYSESHGEEIWVLPLASPYSPYRAYDLMGGSAGSTPREFIRYDEPRETVFLSAEVTGKGRELVQVWHRYSSIEPHPFLPVKNEYDLRPGPEGSNPQGLTIGRRYQSGTYNTGWYDALYFSADDGVKGRELWCFYSDRNAFEYRHTVSDLNSGTAGSNPEDLTLSGNILFFTADNGTNGRELWRHNGQGNVQMVKDIVPGAAGSLPTNLTRANSGSIYFTAWTAATGYELWKSDGTDAGTVMVKEIRVGAAGDGPASLCYNGNTAFLFFSADDGSSGRELWRSDGSVPGTVMVKDIRPGAAGSNPQQMRMVSWSTQTRCFFTADGDGNGHRKLWMSDMTNAGTVPVANFASLNAAPTLFLHDETGLYLTEGTRFFKYRYDGQVPAASQGVWLEPHQQGFTCHWSDMANNETGYRLEYATGDNVPQQLITDTPSNRNYFTWTGGQDNSQYSLTVRAFNAVGFSDWPMPAYVTGWTLTIPPLIGVSEGNRTVTPGPAASASVWLGNVPVTLHPMKTFGAGPGMIGAYRISWTNTLEYYFDGTEVTWETGNFVFTPSATGTYYVHLQALNAAGTPNPVTADYGPYKFDLTPPSKPDMPTGSQVEGMTMMFSWTAASDAESGVSSYECRIGSSYAGNEVFEGNVGDVLQKTFTGTPGQTYWAMVRAVDAVGNAGDWSFPSLQLSLAQFGSLKVSISPPLAVIAGAQWRRKGATTWLSSGTTEEQVIVGTVMVEFKEIGGWQRPNDISATITADTLTTRNVTYVQGGTLTVLIDPSGARDAGGKWRLTRDPLLPQMAWRDSGHTEPLASGSYEIEFKDIPGWSKPALIPVTIGSGSTLTETGVYTMLDTGTLAGMIEPAAARAAGARWRRVGTTTWLEGGYDEPYVPVGTHTVEFNTIAGWTTPPNQSVPVMLNNVSEVQGTYVLKTGALQVNLHPPAVLSQGAKWRRGAWLSPAVESQCLVFASTDVPLSCDGSVATSSLEISTPGNITDINLTVNIESPYNEQLEITLYAIHAGEAFPVLNATGSNMFNTVFDEQATRALSEGTGPYSGVYRPEGSFSDLIGQPAAGTWQLIVWDVQEDGQGDVTTLNSWSLCITTDAMGKTDSSDVKSVAGPWMDSGATEGNVPEGVYEIEFDGVMGWINPEYTTANVSGDLTTTVDATFTEGGQICVYLSPPEAVAAGAQWRQVGFPYWRSSGDSDFGLAEGSYEIEFKETPGWVQPVNMQVAVFSGHTTVLNKEYTQQYGVLTVNLGPSGAVDAGAQWRYADTATWRQSGAWQMVPLGSYTIQFKDAPGWVVPADRSFTVSTDGQEVVITADYAPGQMESDVAPRPDGDGDLLVNDWVQVGRFVAGLDVPAAGSEFQRADCAPLDTSGDGQLLVNDWVQAGRYVAGLDAAQGQAGPTGPPKEEPDETSL